MAIAQTLIFRVVILGANLLTGILSARYLGPSGRAEQAALLIGLSIFPSVFSLGIPMAVQYRMRTQVKDQEQLVCIAVLLSLVSSCFAIAASVILLPLLIKKYSPTILNFSELLMVLAPPVVVCTVLGAVLQARDRFSDANLARLLPPVVTVLGLLCLIGLHRLTPISSALAYTVPTVLMLPWLWMRVRPTLSFGHFRSTIVSLVDYGVRSYVNDLLGTLSVQIDQVLVIGLLSPIKMGIYTVSLSAARVSDLFSGSIVLVLFPKASALEQSRIVELTGRVARLTIVLFTLSTIVLFLGMPWLLPTFYGIAFVEAVPVAQILMFSFVLGGTSYVLSQAFMAAGRPGAIALIQMLGLAAAIPALIVLTPRFGLIGAAWALVVSNLARLVFTLCCFPTVLKTKMPSLMPTRSDISFLVRAMRRSDAG